MNPSQIQQMLAQAQKAQHEALSLQAEIRCRVFTASAYHEPNDEKVTVSASGAGAILSIDISAEAFSLGPAVVQSLLVAAANRAIEQGREASEAEMKRLIVGLGMSGLGF